MPSSMKKVYIAGPITRGNRSLSLFNSHEAHEHLLRAGFAVFNPIPTLQLPFAWSGSISYDEWLNSCKPWVFASDVLLRLPGDSLGASRECEWASEAGIPVFFSHFDIINYFRDRP